MFSLSEQLKEAYKEYLLEEYQKDQEECDKILNTLTENNEEIKEAFTVLDEYFKLYALSEGVLLEDAELGNYDKEKVNDILKSVIKLTKPEDLKGFDYKADTTYEVQTIADMKFPQNLVFFLQQLVKWVKNVVLFFIEKFKNLVRMLMGDSVSKIDYDKFKFNLAKVKKIENLTNTISVDDNKNAVVSAKKVTAGDLELLREDEELIQLSEGITDSILVKAPLEKVNPEKEKVVVTIDLSRDIESLKILMQHFYDLFDRAYGSFNEKFFDTEDLELILKIFADTLKRIKTGDPAREIALGGRTAEVEAISAARVKENLITTRDNVEKLKAAYVGTSDKIKDIAKIINSKELIALSDMGVPYKMLTFATLKQMEPMMKTIPARIKEATGLEKKLEKTKKEYEKLVSALSAMQHSVVTISNITYDTVYGRKINELFVAARYMSDIITLRLSALGLYIKELKDISVLLKQLNNIK